jgi:hypothetical protein
MKDWSVWRVARVVASLFVLMVALYYVVVAFDNITNPVNPNGSNWPFVKGVISGDGEPANTGFEWRFSNAAWFQAAVYVLVIAGESLAGITLLAAGIGGLRGSANCPRWSRAQRLTYVGGLLGLAVFFMGFTTVGGNWYIMFLNRKWNGLDPAFQNSVMTAMMLVLVTGVLIGSHVVHEDDDGRVQPVHVDP